MLFNYIGLYNRAGDVAATVRLEKASYVILIR